MFRRVAVALFSGAYLHRREIAFIAPLGALLLSDLALGFYPEAIFVYLSVAGTVLIGGVLAKRRTVLRVGAAAIAVGCRSSVVGAAAAAVGRGSLVGDGARARGEAAQELISAARTRIQGNRRMKLPHPGWVLASHYTPRRGRTLSWYTARNVIGSH